MDSFREVRGEERGNTYWAWCCYRGGRPEELLSAGEVDSEGERGPNDHVPVFVALRRVR